MPHWKPPYKVRRSTHLLSYAVRQNYTLLETGGEAVYLLKRMRRANEVFQVKTRRVDYIEKTITASASGTYSLDADTGYYRYRLWEDGVDQVTEYPDVGVFTCTVAASGGSSVWEPAVDKYSFISNRNEYAFDIYRNQLDTSGNPIADAIYLVFNTPPFTVSNSVYLKYGSINPSVNFNQMQPDVDNYDGFTESLFSFKQWYQHDIFVRTRHSANSFLLAFPGVLTDITLSESGFLRQSKSDYWTTPPPYSPAIVEHDVVVRSSGERYQVTNYTPIYIEDILVSQHFDMGELDPKSSIYLIGIDT